MAHDFGNLLQVLSNSLWIIRTRTTDQDIAGRVDVTLRNVKRGEALIKQLLTFARRQPLGVEPVDVNLTLADMKEALGTTLPGIELRLDLSPDAWWVTSDQDELVNAVLNLAMNARDAMPGGGTLTLSTRNVPAYVVNGVAGDFVALSVADTGTGMPPAVAARAWEPFYTTKGAGHGTGLGLATVYGFVKQCGGSAGLESRAGAGTRVTLYFPKSAPRSEVETPPTALELDIASNVVQIRSGSAR